MAMNRGKLGLQIKSMAYADLTTNFEKLKIAVYSMEEENQHPNDQNSELLQRIKRLENGSISDCTSKASFSLSAPQAHQLLE